MLREHALPEVRKRENSVIWMKLHVDEIKMGKLHTWYKHMIFPERYNMKIDQNVHLPPVGLATGARRVQSWFRLHHFGDVVVPSLHHIAGTSDGIDI